MFKELAPARVRAALSDESGEVTIAWTVITAGIVGLSVVVLTSIGGGSQDLAENVGSDMTVREVTTGYN